MILLLKVSAPTGNMISKPLLAATATEEADIRSFPLLATPKVDGVRALIINGQLVSRSLKPIPNKSIRSALEFILPEGADGEIYCGSLHDTVSTAMSADKKHKFKFFWFDWAFDTNVPYNNRTLEIQKFLAGPGVPLGYLDIIVPLMPQVVNNTDELREYEKYILAQGFEGIVLRVPNGRYKFGRSTLAEGLMIKLKRHLDSEAIIIGTEELMHKDRAGNTLGAIVAMADDGTTFKIGTGYTANQRLALWANRDLIISKAVKYKHDVHGKNKPRCPVFLGIRHINDI